MEISGLLHEETIAAEPIARLCCEAAARGECAASADGIGCALHVGERTFRAEQGATDSRGEVKAMIRPERIAVEEHGTAGENRLPGLVERAVFLGNSFELHVRVVGGDLLKVTMPNDGTGIPVEEGTAVTLHLPAEALRVLEPSAPSVETS